MKLFNTIQKIILNTILIILFPVFVFSQDVTIATQTPSKFSTFPIDLNTMLLFIAITLGVVIIILAGVLRSAIRFHFNSKRVNESIKLFLIGMITLFGFQDATAQQAASKNIQFGLSPIGWFMLIVIILEIYILISIIKWLKYYTGIEKYEAAIAKPEKDNLWDRINAFKPLDKEATIDTGHDYDGIRELDNVTPPWFVVAFIGTILFAAVYLYRYHIAYSAPSQIKEYEISMKEAASQKMESLKHQANLIDENTVTLLKEGQYEEGKTIFKTACAVCHGNNGQGLVGPNMTDDYWIHGGSVKNIFTTIKYGVLDKGMKSWKDDYSPKQIAQLTSYIKSLRGTNPPDPKAPQGDLYNEVDTASTTTVTSPNSDSLKISH
jgi:cytochrome c oxidase cbb3-type subunit 3